MDILNKRYKRLDWEYRMEYNSVSKPYLDSLRSIENRFYLFQYFTFVVLGIALFFAWISSSNNNISFAEEFVREIISASTREISGIVIIAFVMIGGTIADAIRYFRIDKQLRKLRHEFLLERGV